MGARVTGWETDFRGAVIGGRVLDVVVGGRREVGDTREFARVIMRVVDVVRCSAGREVGLLVAVGLCFEVVGGCGLGSGSGLGRAKGLSSSVWSGRVLNKCKQICLWTLTKFSLR